MARAKARLAKRTSNLRAQAIAKTPAGCEFALVIRLKGGKYASANKPLGKCVLYNVD